LVHVRIEAGRNFLGHVTRLGRRRGERQHPDAVGATDDVEGAADRTLDEGSRRHSFRRLEIVEVARAATLAGQVGDRLCRNSRHALRPVSEQDHAVDPRGRPFEPPDGVFVGREHHVERCGAVGDDDTSGVRFLVLAGGRRRRDRIALIGAEQNGFVGWRSLRQLAVERGRRGVNSARKAIANRKSGLLRDHA
jgi:hypothetical protein